MTTKNTTTRYALLLGAGSEIWYSNDSKESAIEEGFDLIREWLKPGTERCYDPDLGGDYERPKTAKTDFEVAPICSCVPRQSEDEPSYLRGDPDCDRCCGDGYLTDDSESFEVTAEPEEPEVDDEAPDAYALVRTAFHNGGVISYHKDLEHAAWAQWQQQDGTECCCGCAVIVPANEVAELQDASYCAGYNTPAL